MNRSDAKNVYNLHINQYGIKGMMGCPKCTHVQWDNCPHSALCGQHIGKKSAYIGSRDNM